MSTTDKELREAVQSMCDAAAAIIDGDEICTAERLAILIRPVQEVLAAHALRPAPTFTDDAILSALRATGDGPFGETEVEDARLFVRALLASQRPAAAQPAAYLTRDGFPVGVEESVEEHAEPLYRGVPAVPEGIVDDLVDAGRTIERYGDPKVRPLSDDNLRLYRYAIETVYRYRAMLAASLSH